MSNDTHRGGRGLTRGQPDGLGATVAAIADQVSTLEGESSTLDGQVGTLEGQVATLESGAVALGIYVVAGVPPASSLSLGAKIWVTNTTKGTVPVYTDGTNWRYYSDDGILTEIG